MEDLAQMIRILFSLFFLSVLFYAKDLKPTFVYKASGGVTHLAYSDNKLYVATQASSVDVFDLKTKKKIKSIKVPQIKDFMGDTIDAKIYNTDVYKNKVLLTVQDTSGFRELFIYENNKLTKLISKDDKLYISKALFLDDKYILFALLGNTMYLYNYKTKKVKWTLEIRSQDTEFNSTFADFIISKDKSIAVIADESGDLKIIDIKKAKVIKILAGYNLDKVFKVDLKNNKIITAGQDGRCVVYNLNNNKTYFLREEPNWFLIYASALSPSGKLGAYSSDENNNETIFNTDTKIKLYKLTNNLMTLSSILFVSEDEIFVGTDSNKFNYYKLK